MVSSNDRKRYLSADNSQIYASGSDSNIQGPTPSVHFLTSRFLCLSWPHQANKPSLDRLPARPWWPLAIELQPGDSTEDLVVRDRTHGNRQSRSSIPRKSHGRGAPFTPRHTPRFMNPVCNHLRPGLKFQPSHFLNFPWPLSLIYKMGIFSKHRAGS